MGAASKTNEGGHLGHLDGLRGLAALYVVLHHANVSLPPTTHSLGPVIQLIRASTALGHYAVDVFIVLSGYCLILPVLRRERLEPFATFLKRRALRILPPYYACVLVSLGLIATLLREPSGTHFDVCRSVRPFDVLTHLLLVHDWFESSSTKINHVLWSVAVEWKIYLLFPLLYGGFRRLGAGSTTWLALTASYCVWLALAFFDVLNPSPWGSAPYYVGLFALGMLAASATESKQQGDLAWAGRLASALWPLSGAVILVSFAEPLFHIFVPWQWRSLVVGSFTASLLVELRSGRAPGPVSALLCHPWSNWLGKVSYSLYLVHAVVLELLFVLVLAPLDLGQSAVGFYSMMFGGTLVSLAGAYLFYRMVEAPSHEWSRRSR